MYQHLTVSYIPILQVVHKIGLCIALWDIQKIEDAYIFPGDGSHHSVVHFRFVVFRPFMDEIVMGKIKGCSKEGVHGKFKVQYRECWPLYKIDQYCIIFRCKNFCFDASFCLIAYIALMLCLNRQTATTQLSMWPLHHHCLPRILLLLPSVVVRRKSIYLMASPMQDF